MLSSQLVAVVLLSLLRAPLLAFAILELGTLPICPADSVANSD